MLLWRETIHLVKSMTGYGRARETRNGRDITVEVRSVNNRYLDVSVKMPRNFIFAEDAVKAMVQRYTSRGKVDVFVTVNTLGAEETVVAVNEPLAKSYIDALRRLRQLGGDLMERGVSPAELARLPDLLTLTKGEEDLETVSADLCAVLEEALAAYTAMRETEGRRLAEDIGRRLDAIEALTQLVEARSPQTVAEYREKLLARGGHLRRQGGGGRGDRAPAQPLGTAAGHAAQRRARGQEAGLPHPGAQPGVQHDRLQVQRPANRPGRGGSEGGD